MSYEPDTNDKRLRQLKEEIDKIREEQFAKAFPINSGVSGSKLSNSIGGSLPTTGVTSFIPSVIRITKDTGVINLLWIDAIVNDFVIGEIITGGSSSATATVGDVDIIGLSAKLTLVPGSISGTFINNEPLTGDINGDATVDLSFSITQTGRGHLNAGSSSIIAEAIESPAEIHFIDNAKQNGQLILLRAQNGQTIKVRRAVTNDGNTGNIDLDLSFNTVENAIIILQYQAISNVTPDGGWVPVLSDVVTGGSSTSGIDFPILYPKEDLGDQSFVTVNLLLNQPNGHYKRIRMTGDIGLAFNSPPPSINGFKFYVLLVQDGTGGWDLLTLPSSVKNGASILTQIDSSANAQTLIQFVTADGGVTYHAQIISPAGSAIDNPWTVDHDANSFDLFNIDKLRFFPAGGFSFPTDNTVKGLSTSGTGLEINIPISQQLRLTVGGDDVGNGGGNFLTVSISDGVKIHDKILREVGGITFTDTPSFNSNIFPFTPNAELQYNVNGVGAHHAFFVDNSPNANMEMRLNVNKSNVNLDMVTNDIINVDQVQFDQFGGFVSSINHGERRITGGNIGINMNIPKITGDLGAFRVWFENDGLTNSTLEYEFRSGFADWSGNSIQELGGILWKTFAGLGGSIIPFATHIQYDAGANTVHQFKVGGGSAIIEFNDTETGTNQGKIKLFHDLNLQTQDINNVDRLHFNSNNGIVGGNQVAIAGLGTDMQLNVPLTKEFSFRENSVEIASLRKNVLQLYLNDGISTVQSNQYELASHASGSSGMLDGMIRLVNNGGPGLDIMVGTGGVIKNLTNAGGTSFIGFTADDDLDMGTFNIENLDVLRFTADNGVIGFGQYGMAVDAGNNALYFSTPLNKNYIFQHNLEDIASISSLGIQVLSNTSFPNPSMIARQFLLNTHSIGVSGMVDGAFRKVGSDVIIRSGGLNVNLTTLSAGGADNLGNHIPIQDLLPIPNLSLGSSAQWFDDLFTEIVDFANVASTNISRRQIYRDPLGGIGINVPTGNTVRFYRQGSFGFEVSGNDINVTGYTNTNRIQLSVSATNPAFPGEFRMVGGDVYVFSGGLARNLSLSGGSVDVTANYNWTGLHTFNNNVTFNGANVFINSPVINLGNTSTDSILVAGRFASSLITNTIADLGTAINRWNVIYGNSLQLQFGAQINNITTNSATNNNTSVMTSQAVQTLVATVGGVSLGDSPIWTGIHTFNNGVLFNSAVGFVAGSIQPTAITGTAVNLNSVQTISGNKTFTQAVFNITGNINQDGSQIGFRGRTPQSIVNVPNALATLLSVQSTLNLLLGTLRSMGIVGP